MPALAASLSAGNWAQFRGPQAGLVADDPHCLGPVEALLERLHPQYLKSLW
jgi:hypothetical protein